MENKDFWIVSMGEGLVCASDENGGDVLWLYRTLESGKTERTLIEAKCKGQITNVEIKNGMLFVKTNSDMAYIFEIKETELTLKT